MYFIENSTGDWGPHVRDRPRCVGDRDRCLGDQARCVRDRNAQK